MKIKGKKKNKGKVMPHVSNKAVLLKIQHDLIISREITEAWLEECNRQIEENNKELAKLELEEYIQKKF